MEPRQSGIAPTPDPPYYAVIFTSRLAEGESGYGEAADRMVALAATQPGFLGIESVRDDVGITVSYWADLESIRSWKANLEHRDAQRTGRDRWYSSFRVRISRVEREYGSADTRHRVRGADPDGAPARVTEPVTEPTPTKRRRRRGGGSTCPFCGAGGAYPHDEDAWMCLECKRSYPTGAYACQHPDCREFVYSGDFCERHAASDSGVDPDATA